MTTPIGPYTPIVRAGEWLVCSGQLGLKDGAIVDGGVQAQARQAIANLAGPARVGRSRASATWSRPRCSWPTSATSPSVNEVYVEGFGDHRPARSAIAVAALPMGGLVEIEAWARPDG